MPSQSDGTTYTVAGLRCGNCRWSQSSSIESRLAIPKGQPIAQTPCPNCGCTALRRGV